MVVVVATVVMVAVAVAIATVISIAPLVSMAATVISILSLISTTATVISIVSLISITPLITTTATHITITTPFSLHTARRLRSHSIRVNKGLNARQVVQHHHVRLLKLHHLAFAIQQNPQHRRHVARRLHHCSLPALARSVHNAHLNADAQRVRLAPLVLHAAVRPPRAALRRARLHSALVRLLVHHERNRAESESLRTRLDLLQVTAPSNDTHKQTGPRCSCRPSPCRAAPPCRSPRS